MQRLSVIIPTLNEGEVIADTLRALQGLRTRGHEVLIADGGSKDDTVVRAVPAVDRVVTAPRGRAAQMNAGAASASGDVIWFLHADTRAPADADLIIRDALARGARAWGRFDVRLSGDRLWFRAIERMMNLRSCLSGIATGDQGLFMWRRLFDELGGFADIPLMEDIEISRRLKRHAGRPACVRTPLVTSSRRWERHGLLRTVLLMWRLRAAYALGANPAELARRYR